MDVFHDYAYFYNAFYLEKNYVSEAKQVDILLKKYGKNIKKIMNYGCGRGKHDIELTKLGYNCSGIDISQIMINLAKENAKNENLPINFSVADIRNNSLIGIYDAVISLFHVMSYQNSNEDILRSFGSARNILNKGGIFLFDIWYGPGVLNDKPSVRVKEVEDDSYRLMRIAKPIMHDKTNIVDVCYQVLIINKESNESKIINEKHSMRYFFRPELEFFLQETGFKLLDNLDCMTLEETDYNSWTSYFAAKAV